MKQHITKEQWNELSGDARKVFTNRGIPIRDEYWEYLTIGRMIEFLGDDWYTQTIEDELNGIIGLPENEHLCNALWEAVKEKLK